MSKDRGKEFLIKAEKHLLWCERYEDELNAYGRKGDLENVERTFVCLLMLFDTVHQALLDAGKMLASSNFVSSLENIRKTDQMLNYIWNARNSEVHDALVKWTPSIKYLEIKIVDDSKANRIIGYSVFDPNPLAPYIKLFCYLHKVGNVEELMKEIEQGHLPSVEVQESAGVELLYSLDSLGLKEFRFGKGRSERRVYPPSLHLDKPISPSAHTVIECAIKFYRAKLAEIQNGG